MFSHVIRDIRKAQVVQEEKAQHLISALATASATDQTKILDDHAKDVHAAWWDLFWDIMGTYNDGYIVTHGADGAFTSTPVGYPSWWLKAVDFKNAVRAPSSSFANLKKRMDDAATKMAEIDANRHHLGRSAGPALIAV